jgi:hypothetical protein
MADEDAVHQLDYNSHDDSDFSDDEDHERQPREQETHNPESNNNSTEPVTRMMAHYQLLIPFPPSEIVESSEASSQSERAVSGPESSETPDIKLSSPTEDDASSADVIDAAAIKNDDDEV